MLRISSSRAAQHHQQSIIIDYSTVRYGYGTCLVPSASSSSACSADRSASSLRLSFVSDCTASCSSLRRELASAASASAFFRARSIYTPYIRSVRTRVTTSSHSANSVNILYAVRYCTVRVCVLRRGERGAPRVRSAARAACARWPAAAPASARATCAPRRALSRDPIPHLCHFIVSFSHRTK